jgi:hypothetical protein
MLSKSMETFLDKVHSWLVNHMGLHGLNHSRTKHFLSPSSERRMLIKTHKLLKHRSELVLLGCDFDKIRPPHDIHLLLELLFSKLSIFMGHSLRNSVISECI